MQSARNGIAVSIIVALFLLSLSEVCARQGLPQISAEAKEGQESVYVLREYNGMIALFKADNTVPSEVYDVIVKDLPDADVDALTVGIKINSDEQLRQLIEDYSG